MGVLRASVRATCAIARGAESGFTHVLVDFFSYARGLLLIDWQDWAGYVGGGWFAVDARNLRFDQGVRYVLRAFRVDQNACCLFLSG